MMRTFRKISAFLIITLTFLIGVDVPEINAQVSISGKVVDINNRPLTNVIVEFYSIVRNVLVKKLHTNRQGIFTTSINPGDYIIKIYKKGYEYKEKGFHITQASGGFLGTFVLGSAFHISLEANELVAKQGDRVEIEVVVENKGIYAEEANVNIYYPSNWEASFKTENGLEVKRVSLDPSQTKKFKLAINIGRNSTGIFRVILSFNYSSLIQNASIIFYVKERDWKFLNTEYPSMTGVKGGFLKLRIDVTNTLDETSDINLYVKGPENWSLRLEDSQRRMIQTVRLNPGAKISLYLYIRIPENVDTGQYKVILTAESKGAMSHLTVNVNVIEAKDELRLESSHPFVDVYAGTSVEIPFTVINEGYGGTEVFFNLSIPDFIKVQVIDDLGNVLSGIFLDAGSSQKLRLKILVPEELKPQPVPILLMAIGRKSKSTLEMGVNIVARYNITILTENFYKEVTAGERTKFMLEVKNGGTGIIDELSIFVGELPTGIKIEVNPRTVKDVSPGEIVKFTIVIDVDPSVVPGFYLIPIKIIGGEIMKDRLIQVSVKSRSEIIYILLVILLIVIVAISIYRRHIMSKK